MSTPTTTASAPTSNALTLDKLLDMAKELGAVKGKGSDAHFKFFYAVAEGAFQGKIDLDKNKHGQEIDDATKLAKAYVEARQGAVIFDIKVDKFAVLVSKLRTLTRYGMKSSLGMGEPMQLTNNFVTMRQKLRQDPANASKLEDAGNALLRLARAQIKRDQLIEPAELKEFCFKRERDVADVADVLSAIRDKATKLRDGKGGTFDASEQVKEIIRNCTSRLTEIAKAKGVQPADARSAAKEAQSQPESAQQPAAVSAARTATA
jgi:hypothetical protein